MSTTSAALYAGGMDPRKARDLGIAAWANDTNSHNAMSATSLAKGALGKGDQVDRHLLDGNINSATAKEQAKRDLQEVIGKANSLKYGSAEYIKYVNSQDVQDKLHRAGDAFVHVDGDGTHYNGGLGHAYDSILHDGEHDPDDPFRNRKAYKEMAQVIYDVGVLVTGKPNISKSDFGTTIEQVTYAKSEKEQLSKLKQVVAAHVNIVLPAPAEEYGLLGTNHVKHEVITPAVKVLKTKVSTAIDTGKEKIEQLIDWTKGKLKRK